MAQLIREAQLQQAVDVLEDAVDQVGRVPELELKIQLATALRR